MKISVFFFSMIMAISLMASAEGAFRVDVAGYTDKGIHVKGTLEVYSDGSVEGHVFSDKEELIYVEGELENSISVIITNDSWEGGRYKLDLEKWLYTKEERQENYAQATKEK